MFSVSDKGLDWAALGNETSDMLRFAKGGGGSLPVPSTCPPMEARGRSIRVAVQGTSMAEHDGHEGQAKVTVHEVKCRCINNC